MAEAKVETATEESEDTMNNQEGNNEENQENAGMESIHRIAKLPVVESTLQTATSIYEKVKDYNSVTNWTFSTAENAAHKAVEVGKPIAAPVMSHLEGPIKKVDDMLCSGLDYVETKIPAVKLPAGELYENTKEYMTSTVESAKHKVEPVVSTAKNAVEPYVETAKHVIEPAVDKAREMLHMATAPDCVDKGLECQECVKNNEQLEKKPNN